MLHLIETNNLKEDLVAIGLPEIISDVIKGKQEISPDMAQALAQFFQIDTKLFLS